MATALVLLVLTGHAFVVSATHFHRARPSASSAAAGSPQVGQPGGARETTPAGGHEQCLLCRLQRNLVADLQHSAPALNPPAGEAPDLFYSFAAAARRAHLLAPSGRAPPSA